MTRGASWISWRRGRSPSTKRSNCWARSTRRLPSERPKARWLRISIHKTGKEGHRDKDVNIRVPIAIVKTGMRLGALIPGLAGDQVARKMREKGLDVDFTKLDAAAIESVLKGLSDTNIEIDDGKAQVRITCE